MVINWLIDCFLAYWLGEWGGKLVYREGKIEISLGEKEEERNETEI